MKLSVIIPVYNEEQTISEVVERVRAVDIGAIDKEIIIANDGSSDHTQVAIDSSHWAGDPRIKTLQNPINVGKGGAVRLGLNYATGDILLIQDADLRNRMGAAARATVVERFSTQVQMPRVVSIFEEVLMGSRAQNKPRSVQNGVLQT